MRMKSLLAGAAAVVGMSFVMAGPAASAPLGAPRLADSALVSSEASDLIVKTQGRRGGGGGRVGVRGGGGRFVGGGGRGFRGGGGRGLSSGAAIGLGVGAAALGILGAAAAAGAAEAPVYGGSCYIVRQPMYDDWGNYVGRRRVRVCD